MTERTSLPRSASIEGHRADVLRLPGQLRPLADEAAARAGSRGNA